MRSHTVGSLSEKRQTPLRPVRMSWSLSSFQVASPKPVIAALQHYIREAADETLVAELTAFVGRQIPPRILSMTARERLKSAMPALKERAKTLVQLDQGAEFLYTDGPRDLDAAAAKILTPDARAILARALPALEATDWSGPALEEAARTFSETNGLKLGDVAQPLRAALTGRTVSPPLFAMLALLGREESLLRLWAFGK